MRMTASWSGPWTHRIQGCGAIDTRPHAGSPLNVIPTTSIGPPCSELSRHGLANAERVERLVRRPTLKAPARAGFAMLRVENEETDSRSNKETDQESKKDRRSDRLTIKTPYKVWRGQRLGRHFFAILPDSWRQRPCCPVSPSAKPRNVKDYSSGARKPELRGTAWWSWQDSNQQANGYEQWMTRYVERVASVSEPEQLMLTRPCDRCIEEAGDTDSARKPTIDSRFDEAWREESQ